MRLAGWKKTAKADPYKKFLSLYVSEFQNQEPTKFQVSSDDDLPF